VVNLADQPLAMSVTFIDPDSGDASDVGTFQIAANQVTFQGVPSARFRLVFDYPGGTAADAGTCTIDVAEKEKVQFAVIETGAVIAAGKEPKDPAELVVATSSRCKAGKT
jgi:hypothetical protein